MTLQEAKDIVRQMNVASFAATMKLPNSHLHAEAIRLVSEAACNGDGEAIAIQTCVPDEMHFMSLYPHTMKVYEFVTDNLTQESKKNINILLDAVNNVATKNGN